MKVVRKTRWRITALGFIIQVIGWSILYSVSQQGLLTFLGGSILAIGIIVTGESFEVKKK